MRAPGRTRAALERRLCAVVERVTRRSLAQLLRDERRRGRVVRRVALVVGSVIDPARIGNDHIRAHALEGRLFRTALERAAQAARLACSIHVERGLYAAAAARLNRPAAQLKQRVADLGHPLPGPWRADEKTATLAAWMGLRRGD
ncbi:MAG TPA: hypothetical protein VM736_16290 [Gemmatimonadales bacterium]|nr:hypothetical protein [Gemmatimonadales bacterium]